MSIINQNSAIQSLERALVPNPCLIDSRTEMDHLRTLVDVASLINFYDRSNTKNGDWQPFLLKDPVFLVASIAKTSFKKVYTLFINTCTQLQTTLLSELQDNTSVDYVSNSFNQLFNQLIKVFQIIEQWTFYMLKTAIVYNLKTYVLKEVKSKCSVLLWAILDLKSQLHLYKTIPNIKPVAKYLFKDYDEKIWKESKGKMPYWIILGLEDKTTEGESDFNINNVSTLALCTSLQKAGKKIFNFFNNCISYATIELEHIKNIAGNFPDTMLLRTFTSLLKIYKDQINSLSKKHLSFYYKDILKQTKLPATPDTTYVFCDLVKKTAIYQLAKNTNFNAGKTNNETPIIFQSIKSVSLNPATIKDGYTLVQKSVEDSKRVVYLNQTPTPSILSKDENGVINKWKTFGSRLASANKEVHTGIAFASPILYLKQAKTRVITLLFTFTETINITEQSIYNNDTIFYLSTSETWFVIDSSKYVITFPTDQQLQLVITLEATDPEIVAFTKNPDGYTSSWPIFKMLFSKYDNLREPLKISQLVISNNVTASQNFNLYNDFGSLNAKKPFQVFGPTPNVGQNFIIGSAEVFSKPTHNLTLAIDWNTFPVGFDFSIYYKEYNNYLNNKYSESQEEIYENQKKLNQILSGEAILFQQIFENEEVLLNKILNNTAPSLILKATENSLVSIKTTTSYFVEVLENIDNTNLISYVIEKLLQRSLRELFIANEDLFLEIKKIEKRKQQEKELINLIQVSLTNLIKEYVYLFAALIKGEKDKTVQNILIDLIQVSLTNLLKEDTFLFRKIEELYENKEFKKLIIEIIEFSVKNIFKDSKELLSITITKVKQFVLEEVLKVILDSSLTYLIAKMDALLNVTTVKTEKVFANKVKTNITAYKAFLKEDKIDVNYLKSEIKSLESLHTVCIGLSNENSTKVKELVAKSQAVVVSLIKKDQAYLTKLIEKDNETLKYVIEAQNSLLNTIINEENKLLSFLSNEKFILTTKSTILQNIVATENDVLKKIIDTEEQLLKDLIDSKQSIIQKIIAPIAKIFTNHDDDKDYIYNYFSDSSFEVDFKSLTNGSWNDVNLVKPEERTDKEQPQLLFSSPQHVLSSKRVFNFSCNEAECSLLENNPALQNVPLQFTEASTDGFIKMELLATEKYGFGLSLYPKVVAAIALFNGKLIADKVDGPLISPPNPPFTPIATSFKGDYKAIVTYDFTKENTYPLECFHYTPFKTYQVYNIKTGVYNSELLKNFTTNYTSLPVYQAFKNQGELFLELENVITPAAVNFYFELTNEYTNSSDEYKEITYRYLSISGWKTLPVLADETNNLTCSGIVTFNIPEDITNSHISMPGTGCWIAIGTINNPDSFPQTTFLKTNGVRVKRVEKDALFTTEKPQIKANTIIATEILIPEIASVTQPFSSFGGKAAETSIHRNQRVSNRLQTKDRLVTSQDYFNSIRLQFPEVYFSKSVYNRTTKTTTTYVVKKVSDATVSNAFLPLVSECNEFAIKAYLQSKVASSININVLNFKIKYIKIVAEIIIADEYDKVATIKKINEGITIFLAPWITTTQEQININTGVNTAQIAAFIKTDTSVVAVSSISMHLGTLNFSTGNINYGEALQEVLPKSASILLVPSLANVITEPKLDLVV